MDRPIVGFTLTSPTRFSPVKNGEYFVSTRRAALNMAYQEFTEEFGKVEPVLTITGKV